MENSNKTEIQIINRTEVNNDIDKQQSIVNLQYMSTLGDVLYLFFLNNILVVHVLMAQDFPSHRMDFSLIPQ